MSENEKLSEQEEPEVEDNDVEAHKLGDGTNVLGDEDKNQLGNEERSNFGNDG